LRLPTINRYVPVSHKVSLSIFPSSFFFFSSRKFGPSLPQSCRPVLRPTLVFLHGRSFSGSDSFVFMAYCLFPTSRLPSFLSLFRRDFQKQMESYDLLSLSPPLVAINPPYGSFFSLTVFLPPEIPSLFLLLAPSLKGPSPLCGRSFPFFFLGKHLNNSFVPFSMVFLPYFLLGNNSLPTYFLS